MNGLWTVTMDSFVLLRRDKIFLPAVIGGFFVAAIANLASDWTLEEYSKVLFDIGAFGFHFIGSIVAIFWGTKAVADARSEGALELQIATPISRSVCLIGKFLGLVMNLTLLAVILMVCWQILMRLNSFGWINGDQFMVFVYLYLSWCVTAATSIFFASFCGHATALFSSFSAWFVGLSTAQVAISLAPETPMITRKIVESFAWFWDFQRFNIIKHLVLESSKLEQINLAWNALYGVLLIAVLMTSACLIFRKRDLIV